MQPDGALVVLITTADVEEAQQLARKLLEYRLIACANVIPRLRSLFRWDNQLQSVDESLLILKTTSEALPLLTKLVKEDHRYETPEIVALPIVGGSSDYLSWLAAEVHPRADDGDPLDAN